VLNTMDAIVSCLEKPGGCRVVPGLPEDQYAFTLITSIAGGLVFGFCSLIPPQGQPATHTARPDSWHGTRMGHCWQCAASRTPPLLCCRVHRHTRHQ
jgi:hypothetical protein